MIISVCLRWERLVSISPSPERPCGHLSVLFPRWLPLPHSTWLGWGWHSAPQPKVPGVQARPTTVPSCGWCEDSEVGEQAQPLLPLCWDPASHPLLPTPAPRPSPPDSSTCQIHDLNLELYPRIDGTQSSEKAQAPRLRFLNPHVYGNKAPVEILWPARINSTLTQTHSMALSILVCLGSDFMLIAKAKCSSACFHSSFLAYMKATLYNT